MDILNELRNDYLSNRNIAIGSILIIILSYFGYQFVKNRPQNIEITEKEVEVSEKIPSKDKKMIKNEMTSKEVNEMIKKEFALLFKTLTKEIT